MTNDNIIYIDPSKIAEAINEKSYKPYHQWLLTTGTILSMNCNKEALSSIYHLGFNKTDTELVIELLTALPNYDNDLLFFLKYECDVEPAIATKAEQGCMAVYRQMIEYHNSISDLIEQYHDGGFFDDFEETRIMATKLCKLIFNNDHKGSTISFCLNMIGDWFLRNAKSITVPTAIQEKWGEVKPDAQRAVVLSDISLYFRKTTHQMWESREDNPFYDKRKAPCPHGHLYVQGVGDTLKCHKCGETGNYEPDPRTEQLALYGYL